MLTSIVKVKDPWINGYNAALRLAARLSTSTLFDVGVLRADFPDGLDADDERRFESGWQCAIRRLRLEIAQRLRRELDEAREAGRVADEMEFRFARRAS